MKNPAVKRILQEVKEMQSNPSDDFTSLPLEVPFSPSPILGFFNFKSNYANLINILFDWFQENIFEWQFAIRGPRETEFEGGIYHGRIQLPAEYPFKPPSFMLLTVRY